ncbi:hypothetical protein K2173_010818 [Erythroxylum novogranatense]|uniref:Uncharacterized protein n=1 Tax=Erythroxylum novogranatense TaxID=1862640 RepID=A0AAV8SZY7_9ROSI|nr:hypothetical protein K2173_010818 [Erythroxylum novogranatense]
MAGLQYNFFPTDILYPRPQPAAVDTSQKANVLSMPAQKFDGADDRKHFPTSVAALKNKQLGNTTTGAVMVEKGKI